MKKIFITTLFFFSVFILNAQNTCTIISPRPNDTIKNQELFIVCKNNIKEPKNITVLVDEGIDLSYSAKFKDNIISVLYTERLCPGKHTIAVIVKNQNNHDIVTNWDIIVLKRKEEKEIAAKSDTLPQDKIELKGVLNIYSKTKNIWGKGSDYRTDSRNDNIVNLNGSLDYRKFKIPFKLYATNHNDKNIQPQNKFYVGFHSNSVKLNYGDINPFYNKLILYGLNIHGISADLTFINNRYTLQFVNGTINKAIEGSKGFYNISMGVSPANLQSDSSFIINGTYKRTLTAINYLITEADKRAKTCFTFLKSSDVESSIKYGGQISQNIVIGVAHELKTQSNKVKLDAGLSLSMTTFDIRNGAFSRQQIEDFFNTEVKFDPGDYKNLIVLNSTTASLKFYSYPFPTLSVYANWKFRILKQLISINYNRIGSSYYSFGNPLLINDKRAMGFDDQINFWKNKINLAFKYNFSTDNLSRNMNTTRITNMAGSKLVFSPHIKLPSIIAAYNVFLRTGKPVPDGEKVQDMLTENYIIGTNYFIKTGKYEHSCNIFYNKNNNQMFLPEKANNFYDMVNISLGETFPVRLSLTLLYDKLILKNDTVNIDSRYTKGFQIGYSNKKNTIKITSGFKQTDASATLFITKSKRNIVEMNIECKLLKSMYISMQSGFAHYNEYYILADKNYKEVFGMINLKYMLN